MSGITSAPDKSTITEAQLLTALFNLAASSATQAIQKTATGFANVSIGAGSISGSGTAGSLAYWVDSATLGATNTLTNPIIVTSILDASGKTIIGFTSTASAVDYLNITNASSASPGVVQLSTLGTDSNIQLKLIPKGTGRVRIADGTDPTKGVDFNVSGTTTGVITTFVLSSTSLRSITFPDATTTLVGQNTTDTFTNKRTTKRTVTVSGAGATPTTNTDNCDIAAFTALAAAITSMTTNLSGTPVQGDMVQFQFTDNGTARAITWGASFASTTVTLPTTTVISTLLRVLVQWDSVSSKWQCIATA